MSRDTTDLERRGLRLSVVGALAMAGLGFGFSAATGSAAVLLDGIFSLIGFAVGLVALRVATLVRRPDDESFHFGYAAYEPMLNLCKGLLIAFVSLIAAIEALDTILRGGREIEGAFVLVVLLGDGPLARFAPYADPGVVFLLALLSAPVPIQIIRANWDQLLGRAPRPDIQDEATGCISSGSRNSHPREMVASVSTIAAHARLTRTRVRAYCLAIPSQRT